MFSLIPIDYSPFLLFVNFPDISDVCFPSCDAPFLGYLGALSGFHNRLLRAVWGTPMSYPRASRSASLLPLLLLVQVFYLFLPFIYLFSSSSPPLTIFPFPLFFCFCFLLFYLFLFFPYFLLLLFFFFFSLLHLIFLFPFAWMLLHVLIAPPKKCFIIIVSTALNFLDYCLFIFSLMPPFLPIYFSQYKLITSLYIFRNSIIFVYKAEITLTLAVTLIFPFSSLKVSSNHFHLHLFCYFSFVSLFIRAGKSNM